MGWFCMVACPEEIYSLQVVSPDAEDFAFESVVC